MFRRIFQILTSKHPPSRVKTCQTRGWFPSDQSRPLLPATTSTFFLGMRKHAPPRIPARENEGWEWIPYLKIYMYVWKYKYSKYTCVYIDIFIYIYICIFASGCWHLKRQVSTGICDLRSHTHHPGNFITWILRMMVCKRLSPWNTETW